MKSKTNALGHAVTHHQQLEDLLIAGILLLFRARRRFSSASVMSWHVDVRIKTTDGTFYKVYIFQDCEGGKAKSFYSRTQAAKWAGLNGKLMPPELEKKSNGGKQSHPQHVMVGSNAGKDWLQ